MKAINKVSKIFDEYKKYFQNTIPGLHNLLFQILVNKIHRGNTNLAFMAILNIEGHQLVIADGLHGGYIPLGILFSKKPKYVYSASAIAQDLSKEVFGLSEDQVDKIIEWSIQKSPTMKPYTVIGYRDEERNVFVRHCEADSVSNAVVEAVKLMEKEANVKERHNSIQYFRQNLEIISCFEGHLVDQLENDSVITAIDWPGLEVPDEETVKR